MSRRGRGRGRGSRRIFTPLDDDVPLSLFALLTPRMIGKKRPSPKKRPRRRAAANSSRFQSPPLVPTTSEIITLEDTPESSAIINKVKTQMGDFMKSGSFISSDEDEAEMLKANSKETAFNSIFIFGDSDEETLGVTSRPSTSAGPSTNDISNYNKSEASNDDIMEIVDSVLDTTQFKSKQSEAKAKEEMKSLEDFRKKTEELLQDASLLLDQFKTGHKPEPEKPKQEEESLTKPTIGSCPICLESLGNRPASVTTCGHIFCKECITKTAKSLKKCPTCRKPITLKKIHPIFFN